MKNDKILTLDEGIKEDKKYLEIFDLLVSNNNFSESEKRDFITTILTEELKSFTPQVEDYKKNSIIN